MALTLSPIALLYIVLAVILMITGVRTTDNAMKFQPLEEVIAKFMKAANAGKPKNIDLYSSGMKYAAGLKSFLHRTIDPDAERDLTGLIRSQGYPSEQYTVQTEDGFLLDLHRIPDGRPGTVKIKGSRTGNNGHIDNGKPVVFLQHGLLSSACDWVMNFANGSLGFILADAGYDVWMGNSRGNTYSRQHVTLSPEDEKFWDWSFDEMAKYDLPAFMDFILKQTGQTSMYYVGHSQGTTMAFALFSQRPEMKEKVKLMIGLAPVTHLDHAKSPLKYLAEMSDEHLYLLLGKRDFLPSSSLIKILVDIFCDDLLTRWVCSNILFLFAGHDISHMNNSRLDVYLNHSPAGASVKDVIHFAQVFREKKFLMYNYGSAEENEKHYNQPQPPEYNVSAVDFPVVAFTGTNDWLADPEDYNVLMKTLPNVKAHFIIEGWNHLDPIWAMDATPLCYIHVLQWLKKF